MANNQQTHTSHKLQHHARHPKINQYINIVCKTGPTKSVAGYMVGIRRVLNVTRQTTALFTIAFQVFVKILSPVGGHTSIWANTFFYRSIHLFNQGVLLYEGGGLSYAKLKL